MRKSCIILAALALAACNPVAELQAKRAVAARMKDPDSAKFRNVRSVGDAICGDVNGRNGFGAYAGFVPFVFFPADGAVFVASDQMPASDRQALQMFCDLKTPAEVRMTLFARHREGAKAAKEAELAAEAAETDRAWCKRNPNAVDCQKGYKPAPVIWEPSTPRTVPTCHPGLRC
jgi:hypothetical protein